MIYDRTSYRAYLLRVWRTPDAQWRASLEDSDTGERRAFATPRLLVEFLEKETEERAGRGASPDAFQEGNWRAEND
jgi:hypothetical protein